MQMGLLGGLVKTCGGYKGGPEVVDRSEATMRVSDADKDLSWFTAACSESDEGCSAVWLGEAYQVLKVLS